MKVKLTTLRLLEGSDDVDNTVKRNVIKNTYHGRSLKDLDPNSPYAIDNNVSGYEGRRLNSGDRLKKIMHDKVDPRNPGVKLTDDQAKKIVIDFISRSKRNQQTVGTIQGGSAIQPGSSTSEPVIGDVHSAVSLGNAAKKLRKFSYNDLVKFFDAVGYSEIIEPRNSVMLCLTSPNSDKIFNGSSDPKALFLFERIIVSLGNGKGDLEWEKEWERYSQYPDAVLYHPNLYKNVSDPNDAVDLVRQDYNTFIQAIDKKVKTNYSERLKKSIDLGTYSTYIKDREFDNLQNKLTASKTDRALGNYSENNPTTSDNNSRNTRRGNKISVSKAISMANPNYFSLADQAKIRRIENIWPAGKSDPKYIKIVKSFLDSFDPNNIQNL